MSRDSLPIALLLLLGGCAMASMPNDAKPSATPGEKAVTTEAAAPGDKKKIERSPWQPPAEVDPIPPRVEGSDPK